MKRAFFLLVPFFLFATPAQVILMRHAENVPSSKNLSLRGRERANAFVPFFQGSPTVLSYGLPAAIFAAAPSYEDPSPRSIQTVLPLCKELSLSLMDHFTARQTQQLADELLNNSDYEGKMVLVCWPHEQLPLIAQLLGAKKAPAKWADETYDRLWVLDFKEEEVSFKNIPQKLLFGDAPK